LLEADGREPSCCAQAFRQNEHEDIPAGLSCRGQNCGGLADILGKARDLGDLNTYRYYVGKTGKCAVFWLVLTGTLFGAAGNSSTIWIRQWAENLLNLSGAFYMGVFGLLRRGSFTA
jgi:hypothetical protein